MDLEQLKTLWKAPDRLDVQPQKDIVPLLQKESRHLLASLKKRFRRGMVLVPLSVVFVTNILSRHHVLHGDIIYWTYLLFCLGTTIYFIVSYILVQRIMRRQDDVSHQIHKQFNLLSRIFTWRRQGTRITIVVFIVLLEILLYFHQEPSLEKWYLQPPLLRFGAYAATAALLYALVHLSFKYRYERYLLHLKKIIAQFN